MRAFVVAFCLFTVCLTAQTPGAARPAAAALSQMALRNALVGEWVGVLEYRDFGDAITSTKRVQLPTWLRVENTGEGLTLIRYTFTRAEVPALTAK